MGTTWPGHREKTGHAGGDQSTEGGPPVLPQMERGAQMLSCLSREEGALGGRRIPWPIPEMTAAMQKLGQGDELERVIPPECTFKGILLGKLLKSRTSCKTSSKYWAAKEV